MGLFFGNLSQRVSPANRLKTTRRIDPIRSIEREIYTSARFSGRRPNAGGVSYTHFLSGDRSANVPMAVSIRVCVVFSNLASRESRVSSLRFIWSHDGDSFLKTTTRPRTRRVRALVEVLVSTPACTQSHAGGGAGAFRAQTRDAFGPRVALHFRRVVVDDRSWV